MDPGARLPGLMSQFYHLLMLWPEDSCVTLLGLSFLICTSGELKVPFPRKPTPRWRSHAGRYQGVLFGSKHMEGKGREGKEAGQAEGEVGM